MDFSPLSSVPHRNDAWGISSVGVLAAQGTCLENHGLSIHVIGIETARTESCTVPHLQSSPLTSLLGSVGCGCTGLLLRSVLPV
jgi:hypothetical protein